MPSKKNVKNLEDLKEKFSRSKAVVFADFKGLNVSQLTELRRKVKKVGGELKVTKNTLLKLALTSNFQLPTSKFLTGPTAAVFVYDEGVAPLKTLYEFSKTEGLPKLKAGFLREEFLPAERITQLAKLPNKEVLLAQVVAGVNAPLHDLVNVLQGNMRKLVFVLNQLKATTKN